MYRQARDRQTCRQSARGAANMHDPYVNNATTNVPRRPRGAFGRACIEQRALYVTTEPRGRLPEIVHDVTGPRVSATVQRAREARAGSTVFREVLKTVKKCKVVIIDKSLKSRALLAHAGLYTQGKHDE